MSKFETRKIPSINSRELVEELCINGIPVIDSFEKDLAGTQYKSELKTILKYVEYAANGGRLPDIKFKILKGRPKGDPVVEYEFKSDHLRIFGIQLPNKKIILFCGYKNAYDADLNSFRNLKYQYLNSLNRK